MNSRLQRSSSMNYGQAAQQTVEVNRFLALTVILSIVILLAACAGGEEAVSMPVPTLTCSLTPTSEPISEFDLYEGYSELLYDGSARTSEYVEMRDGTRLAVDIYRPTLNGQVVEEPLPVIWSHTRYQRARRNPDGTVQPGLGVASHLIPYGYVVGVVDARGSGASFGFRTAACSPEEAQDAYDITEWFAAQPWCDGNNARRGGGCSA